MRKWFFDLNIDETTYIYFIVVEIDFVLFKVKNLTLNYYNNDTGIIAKSKIIRSKAANDDWDTLTIQGKQLSIQPENQTLNIKANFPDLKMNISLDNYADSFSRHTFIVSEKSKSIRWFFVPYYMKATGSMEINLIRLTANSCTSYVDYVTCDILPFKIPINKMFWGRMMTPEFLITYSCLRMKRGTQVARCFLVIGGEKYCFDQVEYNRISGLPEGKEESNDENVYQLEATQGGVALKVLIRHKLTAASGSFIDPEKFKFKKPFYLLNKLSNNPHGKKYISEADIELSINGKNLHWEKIVCIDEYVLY